MSFDKLKRARLGNSGFTLLEVMTVAFISGFICLVAFTVIYQTQKSYLQTDAAIDTELQLADMAFTLNKIFSYADNIVAVNYPATISTNIDVNTPGQILAQADFSSIAGMAGKTVTIANFRRPTPASTEKDPANKMTIFSPTGIFYKFPDPTHSGVLFIDMGAALPATPTLDPSYGGIFFPRLTSLIVNVVTSNSGTPTGIHFTATARVFIGGTKANWHWCPNADIFSNYSTCNSAKNAPYKDIVKDFLVPLNNQIVAKPSLLDNLRPERVLSGLYIFPIQDLEVRRNDSK